MNWGCEPEVSDSPAARPDKGPLVDKLGMLTFPSPAPLEGVKSSTKDVLKMIHVGAKLPTSPQLDIAGVSVTLSQSSRVALLGTTGIEKPLFLKVLKGQLSPTEGTHMMVKGLCIAHAAPSLLSGFERSSRQTPAEYILSRVHSKIGDEVNRVTDTPEVTETLTHEQVEQHLLDFGLDRISANQGDICMMSKSTQARILLAEIMWSKPQILILDEFDDCFEQHEVPDLIAAIKKFSGGVVVISSNDLFYNVVATEKWIMKKGSLNVELDSAILECGARLLHDSTLNTSERMPATHMASATLPSNEYIKGQIHEIEKKIKDAKTKPLTDSEAWELFDKTISLKKLLFVANAVEVPAGRNQSRIVGVKLTRESRVAAVGEEGRSISELLLGHREPRLGRPQRHKGLAVVHLGPHLAGAPFASTESNLAAIATELRLKQPQVVVIDEARDAGDEIWDQAFSILLESETVRAFRGAVVFCVAEVTPAVKAVCSQRWTGDAGWLWQDNLASDDLEILEDVVTDDAKDVDGFLEEVSQLSREYFHEDSVEKARSRGWKVSLLTASKPDGGKLLCGFICYKLPKPPKAELHIARLAVPKNIQNGGCGLRLMQYILTKAARMPQSECNWISLSALDTAVLFYENFGFTDMTADEVEDPDHFQTWMELKNSSVVSEC